MGETPENYRSKSSCSDKFTCDDTEPCEKRVCDSERRRLLGLAATGSALALAGCTGAFGSPDESETPGEDDDTLYDVGYHWVEDGTEQSEQLEVDGNSLLLDAGLDAGYDLDYFCQTGFCGVCLSKTDGDATEQVDMTINQFDRLTDEAVEAGFYLPCTSRPRDDVDVDQRVDPQADLAEFQEEEEGEEEDDDDDEIAAGVHPIRYVNEEATLFVPEDRYLLHTAEDAGYELPYACREGFCGQCLAQIDGDANELVEMTTNDYGPLDEEAMEDGYTLTCTGQPRGEFDLESGKAGEI